jgi:C_GCAxxG_C_C family probable redox protein
MTTSRAEQAGNMAFGHHDGGFHCAEAVSKAILELYGTDNAQPVAMAATGFGGGIGRSHAEVCGALAGGVVAIGCLMGRTRPGEDWGDVAELTAELREGFLARWGTTSCAALLETFGEQENEIECKRLSGQVAQMLAELLERRGVMATGTRSRGRAA